MDTTDPRTTPPDSATLAVVEPPLPPMPELDPRDAMAHAFAVATDTVAAVTADQLAWSNPSGMTTEVLLGHLVMVAQRVACAGRDVPLQEWPVEHAELALEQWAPAFRAAADDALEAWADDAKLERPTTLPWGVAPGAVVLGTYTSEVAVHTWDLAKGIGHEVAWDDDALELAYLAMRDQLPMADRTPLWEALRGEIPEDVPWEDPFANAVAVRPDAPAIDRLVAWNGRQP